METDDLTRSEPLGNPSGRRGLTALQQAYEIGSKPGFALREATPYTALLIEMKLPSGATDALGHVQDLQRAFAPAADHMEALHLHHREDGTAILGDVLPCAATIRSTPVSFAGDGEQREEALRVLDEPPATVLDAQLFPGEDAVLIAVRARMSHLDVGGISELCQRWSDEFRRRVGRDAPLDAGSRPLGADGGLPPGYATAEEAVDYWTERMSSAPPLRPELPLARLPEAISDPTRSRSVFSIADEDWRRIEISAGQYGIAAGVLPLLVFTEVLRAWSKTPEFCVNFAEPEVGAVPGQTTLASLIPVTATPDLTLADRALRLEQEATASRYHAMHSSVDVVREVRRRDPSAAAPVVHTDLTSPSIAAGIGALGEICDAVVRTPQVWLEHQVLRDATRVWFGWHFVEDLFPSEAVADMAGAARTLLRRLADDPRIWSVPGQVVEIPDRDRLDQSRVNDTATPIPPKRLEQLVLEGLAEDTRRPAIVRGSQVVTREALRERIHQYAAAVTAWMNPDPGDVIAVMLPAGAEQIAAIVGVLATGAAYTVIDPASPAERATAVLDRCEPRGLIAESCAQPRSAAASPTLLTPRDTDGVEPRTPVRFADPDALAYVIFTSGSTGAPKGVMITHRSAGNTVQDIVGRFGIGSDDRVLSLAPATFDLSVFDVFGLLWAGGTIVIPDDDETADPAAWLRLVREHRVTVWNTVPAPMRMFVDAADRSANVSTDPIPLRTVLLSGDWIPLELPVRIDRAVPGARVVSLGGATEGSIWSIHHPIDALEDGWTSVPYGTALANQRMYVRNAWNENCPRWVVGEIVIGGTGVAQGYWRDRERTADSFFSDPATGEAMYRTGDLGRYREDGIIEILGREDSQVKLNGYRVELGEIEACLRGIPGVRHVVVEAPEHPQTSQRQVVAYLVVESAVPLDEQAVRSQVSDRLPSYMVPARVVTLGELPLTPNGKVDHGALPDPWAASATGSGEPSPTSEVELIIVDSWRRHLGHEEFDGDHGFFDAGGDSLHAVGILQDLRDRLTLDAESEQILVEELFLNASPASLAARIEGAHAVAE